MEYFAIIANGWKPLSIITKHSILDVAAALDPLLTITKPMQKKYVKRIRIIVIANCNGILKGYHIISSSQAKIAMVIDKRL